MAPVAPRLARHFTVVATDLRGYGDSGKPPTTADHAPYSKRAMAADQIGVMRQLGFDRFFVAGHDRGARCGYRMALDHPDRVLKLAVLDIIPTADASAAPTAPLASATGTGSFSPSPLPIPERLIGGDPDFFFLARQASVHGGEGLFAPEALDEYLRCYRNPETIHAMCEDYRAAATVDIAHDEADRGVRRIACPVLALWGRKAKLDQWYDVLGIWREWADDVRGRALDCGHYLAEEAPDDTGDELVRFFS